MKGNRLTIPTLKAGEWSDKDNVLLHASFALLVAFVEKEWEGLDRERRHIEECEASECEATRQWAAQAGRPKYDEVAALYRWWTEERQDPWAAESLREEMRLHELDTEMLVRLARIRGWLWT